MTATLSALSVRRMFVGAIAIAATALAFRPQADPDFFWHLRVGQWIVEHHAVPTHDLFTFTVPDHAYVAHEWLSEVLIYVLANALGPAAVTVVFGLVTWAAFLLLWATMRQVPFVLGGITLLLGAAAGNPIWGPRTQMLTFALSVLLLFLLRRHHETGSPKWLYAIPPMFVLWVNLHAGFTIGLVFLVVYVVGTAIQRVVHGTEGAPARRLKPLLLTLGAALVAALINPNLAGIYGYAAQTQFSSAQQRLIAEWASPDFHLPELRAFQLLLVVLVVALAVSQRRPSVTDLLLLVVGLGLSLQSVRHIALFVVVVTPLLGEQLAAVYSGLKERGLRLREPRPAPLIGAANLLVLVLVAVIVGSLRVGPAILGSDYRSATLMRSYPVAALDALVTDPPAGKVFNAYDWGGYFIFRAWPGQRAFIYGEAAVMGDEFLREYASVVFLQPGFETVLDKYQVGWVLDRSDDPLVGVLSKRGWTERYRDSLATVLVRPVSPAR